MVFFGQKPLILRAKSRLLREEIPRIARSSRNFEKILGNSEIRPAAELQGEVIKEEVSTWDISDKRVAQVYKLAYRYIAEKSIDR